MLKRNQKGFTLIELLIVVAIIGILAAIAIPNLLTAMQRAKQKRTMADMRSIATAWEARATDMNKYNAAGASYPAIGGVSWDDLNSYLSPTYIKQFPKTDGWNNAFQYGLPTGAAWGVATAAQSYMIESYGKDGVAEGTIVGGPTTNYDCDIIYSNGAFIQYAGGTQQ